MQSLENFGKMLKRLTAIIVIKRDHIVENQLYHVL